MCSVKYKETNHKVKFVTNFADTSIFVMTGFGLVYQTHDTKKLKSARSNMCKVLISMFTDMYGLYVQLYPM